MKQLWDIGLHEYVNDMWNVIDFVTNSLYVATVALRVVSYFHVGIFHPISHPHGDARTQNKWFIFSFSHLGCGVAEQVQEEMTYDKYATDRPREQWNSWDPMLLSGD